MALPLNNTCRTCLSENGLKSVFDTILVTNTADYENEAHIFEVLMECASVQIERNDELPSQICEKCVNLLKQTYSFKKQCEKSNVILHSYIEKKSTEPLLAINNHFYSVDVDSKEVENHVIKSEIVDSDSNSVLAFCNVGSSIDGANKRNQFVCNVCLANYSTEYELYKHSENEHLDVSLFELNRFIIKDARAEDDHSTMYNSNVSDDYGSACSENSWNANENIFEDTENNVIVNSVDLSTKTHATKTAYFCCTECNQTFGSDFELYKHALKHTEPMNYDRCNEIVETQFDSDSQIQNQGGRVHIDFDSVVTNVSEAKKPTNKINETEQSFVKVIEGEEKKRFACEACGRKFSSAKFVRRHSQLHLGKRKSRSVTHKTESVMCDICSKSFTNVYVLRSHIQLIHNATEDSSFTCHVCNKIFRNQRALADHERRHGEKRYLCDECGKAFLCKKEYRMHAKVHSDVKEFKCPTCGKAFRQRGTLRTHLRTHSDEKPIKCTLCDREFKLRHYLVDHMRRHTGERPYKCTICNKDFPYHKSLIVHKKTHGL